MIYGIINIIIATIGICAGVAKSDHPEGFLCMVFGCLYLVMAIVYTLGG